MTKVKVTQDQQRAIENQRAFGKNLNQIFRVFLNNPKGNKGKPRFVEESRFIHEMSAEQIAAAWLRIARVEPDFVPETLQYLQEKIEDLESIVKEQKFEIEELGRYHDQQKIQECYLLERLKKAEGHNESAATR